MDSGPYELGTRMTGVGLRFWDLAGALGAQGWDVHLVSDHAGGDPPSGVTLHVGPEGRSALLEDEGATLLTDLCPPSLLTALVARERPIIVENAPPIEHLQYREARGRQGAAWYADVCDLYRLQILCADFFLVRSSVERAAVLGSLASAGRLGTSFSRRHDFSDRVCLLPVGFARSVEEPVTAEPWKTPTFIWNGGTWPYMRPLVPARAIGSMRSREDTRLTFLYPTGEVLATRILAASDGKATILPEGPLHADRGRYLEGALAIVVIAAGGMENATCHRLRLRDAFVFGLPVIADNAGATGELVERLQIGMAVEPTVRAVKSAMRAMMDAHAFEAYRANVLCHRPSFEFENNMGSLMDFLSDLAFTPARRRPADISMARLILERHPDWTRR
jgi:hypothetical protein